MEATSSAGNCLFTLYAMIPGFLITDQDSKVTEYANKVLDKIDKYLNPRLVKISKSYTSFFLFDDTTTFSNYAKKVKEIINQEFYMNEKALKALNKYMKYLTEFYKI